MMSENGSPGQNEVRYWAGELAAARKRNQKWIKKADKAVALYSCDEEAENSFNILYANTETLLPAYYNQTPKPIVKSRHGQPDDPLARAVADTVRRGLTWQMDDPDERYTPFDDLMEGIVLQGLVPGRGVLWFQYDAVFHVESQKPSNPVARFSKDSTDTADPSDEHAVPGEDDKEDVPIVQIPEYEAVCGYIVPYDRFLMGYSRNWKTVPWIAREHRMTKADWTANGFPSDAKDECFSEPTPKQNDDGGGADPEKLEGTANVAVVYEIWHKARKSVIFVCESYKDRVLKRVDDPLELPGFYPTYKPLQFIPRPDSLDVIVPYETYREQAKELNRVTQRINKIVEALKVRGFYDSRLKELKNLLEEPDNTLIPTTGAAALIDSGALEKYIWTMPLEKLITVLQQLYLQRQQVKTVIYEITGISDIIRGSTVASETATAQELKSSYGTMRLKRSQRMVQVYVRGCLRIMTSIMGKHYDQETWQNITGLQFGNHEQKVQAQQQLQQMQGQMQQMEQMAQQPGPDGQPQQPPPEMQQMQQQVQQLQQQAQMITWGEVLAVLKGDLTRGYKIDIETNSTIDPEAAMEQKQAAELFGGIGTMLQAIGGLTSSGQLPLAAMKGILLAMTRRFQFGTEVEEHFLAIPDQMPQQGDPNLQKEKEQLEKDKQAMAKEKQDLDMAKMELDGEKKMLQMEKKMTIQEIQMARDQALMDIQAAQQKSSMQMQKQQMALNQKVQQEEFALGQERQDFDAQRAMAGQEMAMTHQQNMHQQRMGGMQQEQRLAQRQMRMQQSKQPGKGPKNVGKR